MTDAHPPARLTYERFAARNGNRWTHAMRLTPEPDGISSRSMCGTVLGRFYPSTPVGSPEEELAFLWKWGVKVLFDPEGHDACLRCAAAVRQEWANTSAEVIRSLLT